MNGAREFKVLWRIVLPNFRGLMAETFLLQFTWIWSDLLFSTVLGNGLGVRSIMNALEIFPGNYYATKLNVVLTATVILSVPLIVLFFLLGKHTMEEVRVSST